VTVTIGAPAEITSVDPLTMFPPVDAYQPTPSRKPPPPPRKPRHVDASPTPQGPALYERRVDTTRTRTRESTRLARAPSDAETSPAPRSPSSNADLGQPEEVFAPVVVPRDPNQQPAAPSSPEVVMSAERSARTARTDTVAANTPYTRPVDSPSLRPYNFAAPQPSDDSATTPDRYPIAGSLEYNGKNERTAELLDYEPPTRPQLDAETSEQDGDRDRDQPPRPLSEELNLSEDSERATHLTPEDRAYLQAARLTPVSRQDAAYVSPEDTQRTAAATSTQAGEHAHAPDTPDAPDREPSLTRLTPPPASSELGEDPGVEPGGYTGTLGIVLGLGSSFDHIPGNINALGLGFGLRGDYKLSDSWLIGGRALYYFGSSGETSEGRSSASTWVIAADLAYVLPFDFITLAPELALGILMRDVTNTPTLNLRTQSSSSSGADDDQTQGGLYISPGVRLLVPLRLFDRDLDRFYAGCDVHLDFVLGSRGADGSNFRRGFQFLLHAGLRF